MREILTYSSKKSQNLAKKAPRRVKSLKLYSRTSPKKPRIKQMNWKVQKKGKNMKRVQICILLSALMNVFIGCGGVGSQGSDEPNNSNEEETVDYYGLASHYETRCLTDDEGDLGDLADRYHRQVLLELKEKASSDSDNPQYEIILTETANEVEPENNTTCSGENGAIKKRTTIQNVPESALENLQGKEDEEENFNDKIIAIKIPKVTDDSAKEGIIIISSTDNTVNTGGTLHFKHKHAPEFEDSKLHLILTESRELPDSDFAAESQDSEQELVFEHSKSSPDIKSDSDSD